MIHSQKIYCGLDVAKKSLDAYMAQKRLHIDNNPCGHRRFTRWLKQQAPCCHVVCESTGGYERKIVRVLQAQQIPVSVVMPSRPRQLARSLGWLAKTDRKDAELLALYGEKAPLKLTPPISETQQQLIELVSYQKHLKDQIVALTNQLEHLESVSVQKLHRELIKVHETQLQKIEEQISSHIQQNDELKTKKEKLLRFQGVGETTAHVLLAHLPELGGDLNRKQLAALVGVAPANRDSGEHHGHAGIHGGRPHVRAALYMAALTASQKNPILATYYQRLIQNGKPPKVALVALMRKLLLALHASLKNPNFVLAS